jgi:hypothetical protein
MADRTKAYEEILRKKDADRDRESSERGVAGAGVEKHGYGGMDTKNKAPKADKEGI